MDLFFCHVKQKNSLYPVVLL